MSSLAPGDLLRGRRWNYSIESAVKGDSTHATTVFKARVLPHEVDPDAPQWAIIKEAPSDNETAIMNLERERQTYLLPGVSAASCFRRMYDMIDNRTIALEWLDTTLGAITYQPNMSTYAVIKNVLKETISSCAVLGDQAYVNTDLKPSNILLSGIETSRVTAKVGDFGLVVPTGYLFNAQPFAMRAPEVFLGQACNEPSQIWAVAAMLLCWIKPGFLGVWDSPHPFIHEAWCMAKIKRLFPNWHIPAPEEFKRPTLQAAVESAVRISKEEPPLQEIPPFEQASLKLEIPPQLRDLLRLMLVVNPSERPSAQAILASNEFQAFDAMAQQDCTSST